MPGDIYFLYLYFYIEHMRYIPVNVSHHIIGTLQENSHVLLRNKTKKENVYENIQ